MNKPLLASLACVMVLGGCGGFGQSRLNPMNWFGRDQVETLAPAGGWGEQDGRVLVPVVSELEVIRLTEGALIRAAGVTATQGWWDVELRPVNRERPVGDALIYEFVVAGPRAVTPVSTEVSRTVTAGVKVSNARLQGVRRIIVRGAQNQREIRR